MTSAAIASPNPSRTSHYVTDDFYTAIVAQFAGWQRDDLTVTDLPARDRARQLLEREARLLDSHAYEDWLGLFTPECIYWIPGTPERGDPRR
ncbi:unnamed protein product, partial [Phaeothamnion confervicola]